MTYEDALLAAALADSRIVVMTAENRAAIRNLPGRLPERFIDVGICEQTMIGMAAGLALRGRVPVVHALATFLTLRAFEFIRTDVGLPGLPVKLVGYVPGFLSEANGPTHQAIDDVAVLRAIPGMQIVCPVDEAELVAALPAVLASPRPTYVRFAAGPVRVPHATWYGLGQSEVLAEGRDATVLVYGPLAAEVFEATRLLAADGVQLRVMNLRSLVPLDDGAVLQAARDTGLLVTVEDHLVPGGLFSIVAELLARHGVAARVVPLGLERPFRPALLPDVLRVEGFDAQSLAVRIRAAVRSPRARGGVSNAGRAPQGDLSDA